MYTVTLFIGNLNTSADRGVARILTIGGQDRKIAREAREKFLNTGHTH